ncbi:juvenile hormone acid O-methyltransferase-like [Amblyomma americanum]
MKFRFPAEFYAKYLDYPSRLNKNALENAQFLKPLTKDQQVLEVGCGTGQFAQRFLLPHCRPCRRLVATDIDPDMIDFARDHYPRADVVYDVLDIATNDLGPFSERYGKFDRVLSFLAVQLIQDQKTAYSNIVHLLNDEGECLVLAFSSLETVDVWAELCGTEKWRGRIPDPAEIFNRSFNFNCLKTATEVEAEVRDTLRGTGLECLSCEVYEDVWKYDDMDSLLDIVLSVLPFNDSVPEEEWEDFRLLWAERLSRKLSASPGQPLEVKVGLYVFHARRSSECAAAD